MVWVKQLVINDLRGPIYLTDEDGDGYLENARDFYTDLPGGAMGLLADETGLFFVGGRGLETGHADLRSDGVRRGALL